MARFEKNDSIVELNVETIESILSAEEPTEREEKKENNNTRLTKSGEPDKRFKKNKNL